MHGDGGQQHDATADPRVDVQDPLADGRLVRGLEEVRRADGLGLDARDSEGTFLGIEELGRLWPIGEEGESEEPDSHCAESLDELDSDLAIKGTVTQRTYEEEAPRGKIADIGDVIDDAVRQET